VCLVMNKNELNACASCEEPRPDNAPKPAAVPVSVPGPAPESAGAKVKQSPLLA
jgi:hypothetical protein